MLDDNLTNCDNNSIELRENDCKHLIELNSSQYEEAKFFDILAKKTLKIDEKFIIKITNSSVIYREAKMNCKVMFFSSEWAFDDVLTKLDHLNRSEYPNLFIFIVENRNIGYFRAKKLEKSRINRKMKRKNKKVKKLRDALIKFSKNYPIILQLRSKEENFTKLYYKDENLNHFNGVSINEKSFKEKLDFSSFLCSFMVKNLSDFKNEIVVNFTKIHSCSLIMKFLRLIELTKDYLTTLILTCAAHGSINNLLAILDAPFVHDGTVLNIEAQSYIESVITEKPFDEVFNDLYPNEDEENSKTISSSKSSENEFDQSLKHDEQENISENGEFLKSSILYRAVQNSNNDMIDYLIKNCTHLIQQLHFEHQIVISTTAFNLNQLDILCDLIELSDFPFPKNFQINNTEHKRLKMITDERNQLHVSIFTEKNEAITEFLNKNLSLRVIYSSENKSVLQQAFDLKKFNVYYYYKSIGFYSNEILDFQKLNREELKEATNCKIEQRKLNVKRSISDPLEAVMLLSTRSFIHNRKINKDQYAVYHKKIKKWYEELSQIKYGSEFIKVAASCKHLRIIFDFENFSADTLSLDGSNAWGSVYPTSKWIFVGAKLSDKKREQQIKGVLAHELCHYVMKLVYENQENPYYKHMIENKIAFEAIVSLINKWSSEALENVDDECNGTISSVFQLYSSKDFHPELIVRVMQILAEFDDDEEKSEYLENKYKELFDHFRNIVFPELLTFNLKFRKNIRKINEMFEFSSRMAKKNIEFIERNDQKIVKLFESNLLIVTTNIPKLLFSNIHNSLYKISGCLYDTQNVFVDVKKLKKLKIEKKFKDILNSEFTNIRVFVDFSKEFCEKLDKIIVNNNLRYIFVVSNESQKNSLTQLMFSNNLNPSNAEITYNWNDLATESQKLLMQKNISFQNNSSHSFYDLLKCEIKSETTEAEQEEKIFADFLEVADEQLLNLLIEEACLHININIENDLCERNFHFLFKPRNFIKKAENLKTFIEIEKVQIESITKVSDIPFFSNDQNILQSDIFLDQIECKSTDNPEDSDEENFLEKSFSKRMNRSATKKSESEFLDEIKDAKHVLISDIAGNGKSWMLKYLTKSLRIKHSTKWVTYVDLKKFIKEFKLNKLELNFPTFIVEKILKLEINFEKVLFRKLYENGKTCILFDGFDEIAPNYAEFVSHLAKSLKFNGGNQLWITTRDYYQINIQKEIHLQAAYKLDEFSEEDAIDFIAKNWILSELDETIKTKDDFEKHLKNSLIFDDYKKTAKDIIKKIFQLQSRSVGMPHLFKMIADGFRDDKNVTLNLHEYKIFEKFAKDLYLRWSTSKGEIRMEANAECQRMALTFWKFHQYSAIKSIFPKSLKIFFPKYCEVGWKVEEIISSGLMSKRGEYFYFLHDTFREFFIADFFARSLKELEIKAKSSSKFQFFDTLLRKKNFENCLIKGLIKILKFKNQSITRLFLNDAIEDPSVLQKIKEKIQDSKKFIDNFECFDEYFIQSYGNLIDFLIFLLQTANYKKVKCLIYDKVSDIINYSKNEKILLKFVNFIFTFLSFEDIKELLVRKDIIQKLIDSNRNFTIFASLIYKIEENFGLEYVKFCLRMINWKENMFHTLYSSSNFEVHKVSECLMIMQKIRSSSQMIDDIKKWDSNNENIFFLCVKKECLEEIKIVWTEIEKFLTLNCISFDFIDLILHKNKDNASILHYLAKCTEIEFHETLWKLLTKSFKNRKDLKKLILQEDKFRNNFIQMIVKNNKNSLLIERTLLNFEEYFDEKQYREILRPKERKTKSLLNLALIESKNFQTVQILWKTFQNMFNNDRQFLEMLIEVDKDGRSVLHAIVKRSSFNVLEFLINELDKIAYTKEIKKLLGISHKFKQNLLQSAARNDTFDSIRLHELLWDSFRKYFEFAEIRDFILHVDINGDNLISTMVSWSTLEVVELTWKNIEQFLSKREQIEYIESRGWKAKNLFEISLENRDNPAVHEWVRCKSHEFGILNHINYFSDFVTKIENCIATDNKETLKILLMQVEKSDQNIKEIVQKQDFKNQNILQYFAYYDKVEFHKILWEFLLKIFDDCDELKKFILQTDEKGNNFLSQLVKTNNNAEIIEYTFNNIQKKFNKIEFQRILKIKDSKQRNLLHISVYEARDLKVFKTLFQIFYDTLKESIFDNLKEIDDDGLNIFHVICRQPTNNGFLMTSLDILDSLLKEKNINVQDIQEIFNLKDMKRQTILHHFTAFDEIRIHIALWKLLFNVFTNRDELMKFILYKDSNGYDFMHLLLKTTNNTALIETVLDTFEKKFNEKQIQEILKSKEQKERTLLQSVLIKPKNSLICITLWKKYRSIFNNDNEFLELISCVDKNKNNPIYICAYESSEEVFELILDDLNNLEILENTKLLIGSFNNLNQCLIQIIVEYKHSLKIHEKLWTLYRKVFDPVEILHFINHIDVFNNNILSSVVGSNTSEIVEFTWKEIKIYLKNHEVTYLKKKGSDDRNLLEIAFLNNQNYFSVHKFIQSIFSEYEIHFESIF